MKGLRWTGLALLGLLAAGCGKKGSIHPPLLLVPQPATGLRAGQSGDAIILEWTNPSTAIDGSPLAEVAAVEIWAAAKASDFPAGARLLARLSGTELAAHKNPPAAGSKSYRYSFRPEPGELPDKPKAFAIRVESARKKRLSAFSTPVEIALVPIPRPPSGLTVKLAEGRVELRWKAPEANIDGASPPRVKGYNVYRAEVGQTPRRLNAKPFAETVFEDGDFANGKTYTYAVRAAATDVEPFAESLDSPTAVVTPADVFPPAPPTGLAAAAGADVITLLWEANREKDIAGYRVWRREAGRGAFVPLTPKPAAETTYTDGAAVKGRRYEYAVTAVDRSGNESAKSAAVAEILKSPRP